MTDKNDQDQDNPNPYSFEVRFGKPAIAQGVIPSPRIVVDHYALLGVKDREMMWIIHLLAYKWTADNPFPKRRRFRCSAQATAQKRTARHLRELGLLFTSRKYRKGRMVSLIYDLDSLLHNCVRLFQLIEGAVEKHLVHQMIDPELASKWQRENVRQEVMEQVAQEYKVELPPDVMTRLKAGKYQDVPPPWDKFCPPPPDPVTMTGQQALDILFPRETPIPLETQADNGKDKKNVAVPIAAGGADSVSGVVLDGVCRWNGMSQGKDSLPTKKRTSQQRQVAQVIGQWGGGTVSQAKLAWEAWTVRVGWPAVVSVHSKDFENKFGPLLVAVRDGDITAESLEAEAIEAGLIDRVPSNYGPKRVTPEQIQAMKTARVKRLADAEKARKEMQKIPSWWRASLGELQLQMTKATFDTWLRNTDARVKDGIVTIYCETDSAVDWLTNRLYHVVLRTLARLTGWKRLTLTFVKGEPPDKPSD